MTRPASPPSWIVPVQAVAEGALLLPGGPRLPLPAGSRAVGAGLLVLGCGAVAASAAALRRDLTAAVVPRDGARLRTAGAYGLSRHPMYVGLLLASAGTVLVRGRVSTAVAAAVLAAVLHVKAGEEDRVLAGRFGGAWQEYASRVPRLVGLPRR